MDTNLVLPLGPRKCQVIFDYFLEAALKVSFVSICLFIIAYYFVFLYLQMSIIIFNYRFNSFLNGGAKFRLSLLKWTWFYSGTKHRTIEVYQEL